jgi:hypothetical protein
MIMFVGMQRSDWIDPLQPSWRWHLAATRAIIRGIDRITLWFAAAAALHACHSQAFALLQTAQDRKTDDKFAP